MNWELIWKTVFIVVLAAFAVMSVLVTLLGARDVKRLIRHLTQETKDDSE